MKAKGFLGFALALSLCMASGHAWAATAGSTGDPLISLEWLKSTFLPQVKDQVEETIDQTYDRLETQLTGSDSQLRIKRNDVIRLEEGCVAIPLAGGITISAEGSVFDVTAGSAHSTGKAETGHKYLVGKSTSAAFCVTSETAVLQVEGPYQLNSSSETDYNALADGLVQLGLFRGSDTPYGKGYALELAPTRIQGLIMFLRLLGVEEEALQYTSQTRFSDVPAWATAYAAYAYDKGYTKGQGIDREGRVQFGSEGILTARDYQTFLLRALQYQEGKDFQWLTAIADSQALGVLTAGESALLQNAEFLRAHVVYLSYYALTEMNTASGQALHTSLIGRQLFTATQLDQVRKAIPTGRL